MTVPHDRRHNDTLYIAPLAISLRHLSELIEKKMCEMFPESNKNAIPSLEYLRYAIYFYIHSNILGFILSHS